MRDSLTAFYEFLAARYQSPRTMRTYHAQVLTFVAQQKDPASTAPPSVVEIESFLGRPRQDGARRVATSRNQALSALRAFAAFGMRELGWPDDPTKDIDFAREPPRDPAVLTTEEVRLLFSTAAKIARPSLRARDLAILALLSQSALRVHELVALDLAQVDIPSATLLAVKGKGGTVHDVPLHPSTLGLVGAWLEERATWKVQEEHALVLAPSGKRLSTRAVQQLFVRLREGMGTTKKITPHTMRHSAATLALFLGTDLVTVAGLLRHADLNTTRRYIHLIDAQRREAVRRLAASTIPAELVPAPRSQEASPITPAPTVAEEGPPSNPQSPPTSGAQGPCTHHDMDEAAARQRAGKHSMERSDFVHGGSDDVEAA